jgi:hypothetical protein
VEIVFWRKNDRKTHAWSYSDLEPEWRFIWHALSELALPHHQHRGPALPAMVADLFNVQTAGANSYSQLLNIVDKF